LRTIGPTDLNIGMEVGHNKMKTPNYIKVIRSRSQQSFIKNIVQLIIGEFLDLQSFNLAASLIMTRRWHILKLVSKIKVMVTLTTNNLSDI